MHDVTSEGRAPANLGGAVAIVDGGGAGREIVKLIRHRINMLHIFIFCWFYFYNKM